MKNAAYSAQMMAAISRLSFAAHSVHEAAERGDSPDRVRHYLDDVQKWARCVAEDIDAPVNEEARPIALRLSRGVPDPETLPPPPSPRGRPAA